jgi:flagellar hook protein FlgE
MAGEQSTIQSLKSVDAWIDVINANINGGVRTGFKSSRLKFGGSNVDILRAGTATSSPLQIPEAGLMMTNTVIDFSQGAVTASTENTHLAVQGEGFFLLASPDMINTTAGAAFGTTVSSANAKMYLTRDGEFRTNAQGLLVNSAGYYLVTTSLIDVGGRRLIQYDQGGNSGAGAPIRAIFHDVDITTLPVAGGAIRLSNFLTNTFNQDTILDVSVGVGGSVLDVQSGKQSLTYTQFGSTIFDLGFVSQAAVSPTSILPPFKIDYNFTSTVLSKSLEASNASMTQSVPELSLAQKLFSALTKVLQTKQTNIDGVLNLVR